MLKSSSEKVGAPSPCGFRFLDYPEITSLFKASKETKRRNGRIMVRVGERRKEGENGKGERERKESERKISDLLIAATSVVRRRHTAGHNEKQYGQDTWHGSARTHLGDYPELKS